MSSRTTGRDPRCAAGRVDSPFDAEIVELEARIDPLTETLEIVTRKPMQSDVIVRRVGSHCPASC